MYVYVKIGSNQTESFQNEMSCGLFVKNSQVSCSNQMGDSRWKLTSQPGKLLLKLFLRFFQFVVSLQLINHGHNNHLVVSFNYNCYEINYFYGKE